MMRIFPIAAGKGGVGKSFIAANIAALIAKQGNRVVLIDLDLGAANLHTLLGVKNTQGGLDSFLNKTSDRLDKVAVPTQVPNLAFISSAYCSMEIANLYHAQKIKLINAIRELPVDYVLLDLGAGTHFNTLDFFLTSHSGIFVCTPEPTSIENAFRFIKAAYWRKLKQIINHNAFHNAVKEAVRDRIDQRLGSADIVELVLKYDPGREMFLRESIGRFQFNFILNQFRKNSDISLGEKIKVVCNRHFYSPFEYLGAIDYDERVIDTIAAKTLFATQHPDTKTALDLSRIAQRMTRKSITPHLPRM